MRCAKCDLSLQLYAKRLVAAELTPAWHSDHFIRGRPRRNSSELGILLLSTLRTAIATRYSISLPDPELNSGRKLFAQLKTVLWIWLL